MLKGTFTKIAVKPGVAPLPEFPQIYLWQLPGISDATFALAKDNIRECLLQLPAYQLVLMNNSGLDIGLINIQRNYARPSCSYKAAEKILALGYRLPLEIYMDIRLFTEYGQGADPVDVHRVRSAVVREECAHVVYYELDCDLVPSPNSFDWKDRATLDLHSFNTLASELSTATRRFNSFKEYGFTTHKMYLHNYPSYSHPAELVADLLEMRNFLRIVDSFTKYPVNPLAAEALHNFMKYHFIGNDRLLDIAFPNTYSFLLKEERRLMALADEIQANPHKYPSAYGKTLDELEPAIAD